MMDRTVRAGILVSVAGLALCAAAPGSHAVILYWSADRATFEPQSCYYAGSGWQYQGRWGIYLGTPIAPNYFITAKHVGGSIGQGFTYNDGTPNPLVFTTTAYYDSPTSDLRIWQVGGTFSSYAPLYTLNNEVGRTMTVFGRGTARGNPVVVNDQTKGWTWGTGDHVQSWGSNTVSGISDGGAGISQLLSFAFDATGDYYEGSLSSGDSGGGVFIQDGGTWKLAGINYGTDGRYSYTGGSNAGFNASLFDQGGLYIGSTNNWTYRTDQVADIPGSSYATRISANMTWITSVIGPIMVIPEPASAALLILGAAALPRRRGTA